MFSSRNSRNSLAQRAAAVSTALQSVASPGADEIGGAVALSAACPRTLPDCESLSSIRNTSAPAVINQTTAVVVITVAFKKTVRLQYHEG